MQHKERVACFISRIFLWKNFYKVACNKFVYRPQIAPKMPSTMTIFSALRTEYKPSDDQVLGHDCHKHFFFPNSLNFPEFSLIKFHINQINSEVRYRPPPNTPHSRALLPFNYERLIFNVITLTSLSLLLILYINVKPLITFHVISL